MTRVRIADAPAVRLLDQDRTMPTLLEWKHIYLASRRTLAVKTMYMHTRVMEDFVRFFGPGYPLDLLSVTDCARWIQHRRDVDRSRHGSTIKARESTIAQEGRAARTVLTEAVRQGYIRSNPMSGLVPSEPVGDREWVYLTRAQSDCVLDSMPHVGMRCLFALMRLGALRLDEALRQPWDAIDFGNAVLAVQPPLRGGRRYNSTKARPRVVPIEPRLGDILQECRREYPDSLMPCSLRTMRYKEYRQYLAKYIGQVTDDRVCPHDLRRACITDWCEILPVATVAQISGNSVQALMERYHRARIESIRPALEMLSRRGGPRFEGAEGGD